MVEAHLPYIERLDAAEFRELMITYGQDVWNLAFILTKRHEVADDISQDVFLSAFRSIGSFRGASSVRTWLLAITRNAAINYRRSAFVRKVSLVEWVTEKNVHPSAENEALGRTWTDALWEKLLTLPYKQREVLILHAKYELSIREISALLHISEGAVKTRLFRARKFMSSSKEETYSND